MHAEIRYHDDNGGGFQKSVLTNTPINTVTIKNISVENLEQAITELRAVVLAHVKAVPVKNS